MAIRRRRRRNATKRGGRRVTARRAYMKTAAPRRRRRRKNTWKGNRRGHSRAAKKGWRGRRRRRNPSRRNPSRRRVSYSRNPFKALQSAFAETFSMDTVEHVFHTGLGFAGAIAGSNLVADNLGVDILKTGWGKVGTTGAVSAIESGIAHMVTKDSRLAKRILVGGMLATLLRALGQIIPAGSEARKWVPTLGNRNSQFRSAIEREVLRELRGGGTGCSAGMGAYMTPRELQNAENRSGMGSYYRPAAGSSAYLTAQQGRSIDTYGFAGYSGPVSEFGNAGSPRERF